MIKQLFLGLAAMLTAAGNAAKAFAEGVTDEAAADAPAGAEEPKRGRGRPAKTEAAAPAEPSGPTDEERFESNRALIKPLVEGGQGEDVKKVIAKYSKTGLKDVPADKQAAFEKDIDALSY